MPNSQSLPPLPHAFLLKMLQPLATLASGIGKSKKLLIMIYHRVLDEPDPMRPGEVDKATFTWHMQLLATHFNVFPLDQAVQRLEEQTLPPRAVAITFDDGYADNFTNALPILQRFNFNATFFIASGFLDGGRMWNDTVIEAVRNLQTPVLDLTEIELGYYETSTVDQKCQTAQQLIQQLKYRSLEQRNHDTYMIATHAEQLPDDLMMSKHQVQQLQQQDMIIGGHTVSHPILAKLDLDSAAREIQDNKVYLEQLLGRPLGFFAYPNGKPQQDYLSEHIALVKQAGYQAAVSTQSGVAGCSSDSWQLPRFTPWDQTPTRFMLRLIGHLYRGRH